MQNKCKKIRNLGTVYYDNTKKCWIGQVANGTYLNNRIKYKRFCGSQQEVISKMKAFKADNQPEQESIILVSDCFMKYLRTVKKNSLKPSSYSRLIATLNNNIIPYIGGYDIKKLSAEKIQIKLINKLVENGYSYSTIHKVYNLVNECLRYCVHQEIILKNPCEFVVKPSKKIFSDTKEIRFFNDDEIERFKPAALFIDEDTGNYHYTNGIAILSLIYTGLRGGELMALKWSDIDLKNEYMNIHSNVVTFSNEKGEQETILQYSTKTKKSRIVYLTKSAKKYLTMLYNITNPAQDDFVIVTSGKRILSTVTGTYRRICKRADIANTQGIHTLRHTFASLMIRNNIDIKIISEMLGHSDVGFTYNTYVHLIEEEKAKAMKTINI